MGIVRNIIVLFLLSIFIWMSVAFINTPSDNLSDKLSDFYHSQLAYIKSKYALYKNALNVDFVSDIESEINSIKHPKTRIKAKTNLINDLSQAIKKQSENKTKHKYDKNILSKIKKNDTNAQIKQNFSTSNSSLDNNEKQTFSLVGNEANAKQNTSTESYAKADLNKKLEKIILDTFDDFNANYNLLDPKSKDELVAELVNIYIKNDPDLNIEDIFKNSELLSSFYLSLALNTDKNLDINLISQIKDDDLKELYLFILNQNKNIEQKSWIFELKVKISDLENLLSSRQFIQAKHKLLEIKEFMNNVVSK